MSDDERIADLLLQWEELAENGQEVPAGELCRDCPQLADELDRRIQALKLTAWVKKPIESAESYPTQSINGPETTPESGDGTRIVGGRYRLDGYLAEGGFGHVWRGFDLDLERPVAVKLPRSHHSSSPDESFLVEARKLARLKHPGIVAVHDVGRTNGSYFIVCDLIEGSTLQERTRSGRSSVEEAVSIVAQVADALHHAHENGFTHRDIKPGNILIDRQGKPFLADFGIALTKEEVHDDGRGTLVYMSPEQLAEGVIDHRVDIYGLGVVLYQLLTGRLPFDAQTPTTLREQIINDAPPSPRSIEPSIPLALERICLKCLSKEPSERFATARLLSEELRAACRSRTSRWPKALSGVALLLIAVLLVYVVIPERQSQPNNAIDSQKTAGKLEFVREIGEGQLHHPIDVAIDERGNVYVADTTNHRVQVFDKDGKLLRVFGKGGGGDGEFRFPQGIALTPSGDIVVGDLHNNRVQVFDSQGMFLRSFGGPGSDEGQMRCPRSVAIDTQGRIVVADEDNHRVQIFDRQGRFLKMFGGFGNASGQFRGPFAVDVGPDDQIYVADTGNYRVQVFDKNGKFSRKFGSVGGGPGEFGGGSPTSSSGPRGIAVDKSGNIFVTDTFAGRVQVFDPMGRFVTQHEGVGKGNMSNPHGLAVNSAGTVVVCDHGGNRIKVLRWKEDSLK